MKKILLPVLFLTLLSCGKTEIKEIEKIVEVEKEVEINPVKKAVDETMGDQENKPVKYSLLLDLLKSYVNGPGSSFQGYHVYVGHYTPSGSNWVYSQTITFLGVQNLLVKDCLSYAEGFDNLKKDENQKPLVNGSLQIHEFFYKNKEIGYITKEQLLNLKAAK